MQLFKSLHHSGIVVKDIEKSVKFYCDVLGMQVADRRERIGGSINFVVGYEDVHIECVDLNFGDGHLIELIQYHIPEPLERPTDERSFLGASHIAFIVDNIGSAFQHLINNGAKEMNNPVEVAPGKTCCYIRDPDGNWIELIEFRSEE